MWTAQLSYTAAGIDLERREDIAAALHANVVYDDSDGRLTLTFETDGATLRQAAETALRVQAEVRAAGAVPATTAVIDGRLCAGLDDGQIERLARAGSTTPTASRRDLPVLEPAVQHLATVWIRTVDPTN